MIYLIYLFIYFRNENNQTESKSIEIGRGMEETSWEAAKAKTNDEFSKKKSRIDDKTSINYSIQ